MWMHVKRCARLFVSPTKWQRKKRQVSTALIAFSLALSLCRPLSDYHEQWMHIDLRPTLISYNFNEMIAYLVRERVHTKQAHVVCYWWDWILTNGWLLNKTKWVRRSPRNQQKKHTFNSMNFTQIAAKHIHNRFMYAFVYCRSADLDW